MTYFHRYHGQPPKLHFSSLLRSTSPPPPPKRPMRWIQTSRCAGVRSQRRLRGAGLASRWGPRGLWRQMVDSSEMPRAKSEVSRLLAFRRGLGKRTWITNVGVLCSDYCDYCMVGRQVVCIVSLNTPCRVFILHRYYLSMAKGSLS